MNLFNGSDLVIKKNIRKTLFELTNQFRQLIGLFVFWSFSDGIYFAGEIFWGR